ncbi:hypothetical protein MCAMS1_00885 [biofilm metagenome]
MNTLKTLATIAVFGLAFTSNAVYAENNEQVKAAIDQTIAKLEETVAAIDKGGDNKTIVDLVIEAKQAQKSIASSDPKISIKKSQGSNKLGQARTAFNDGDAKKGAELVKEALAGYKEVKDTYNASH